MNCRNKEAEKHWFRSDRFFNANGSWFFTTRENVDVGPFGTEKSARQGLDLYIQNMQSEKASLSPAATVAVNGNWASTLYQ